MLHDRAIQQAVTEGSVELEPFNAKQIQPASYDFTLGNVFLIQKAGTYVVDVKQDNSLRYIRHEVEDDYPYTLGAGQCVLAVTKERVKFGDNLAGRLEGKSSLGRLFLTIHVTAGFFDPGFEGYPTLELINNNLVPIVIYPGMPIAQMSFFRLEGRPTQVYGSGIGSKYQNQGSEPVPSKYHLNFE